jgi:hypothetical protein
MQRVWILTQVAAMVGPVAIQFAKRLSHSEGGMEGGEL